MFLDFFYNLKQSGLPVSLHEYLTLMQGLDEKLSLEWRFTIDEWRIEYKWRKVKT